MSHAYMRLSDVSPEDVEDGFIDAKLRDGGVIDDRDIIEYIRKYSASTQGYTEFYFALLQDIFYNPNLKTNRLFVENPVTGQFQVLDSYSDLRDVQQKRHEQAKLDADDKQLEQILTSPSALEIEPEETLDLRAKILALPPKPKRSNAQNKSNNDNNDLNDSNNSSNITMEEEWQTVTMEYRNFAFVKRMVFLVFQGLLAGFCIVTVYFQECLGGSTTEFFTYYQPFAQEIRRYCYILSTLALLGSIDHFLTTWNHISTPNPLADGLSSHFTVKLKDYQRISLLFSIVSMLCYGISLLCSVLMAPFDVRISIRNNPGNTGNADSSNSGNTISIDTSSSNNNWALLAVSDHDVQTSYDSWSLLSVIRAAMVLLAWLLLVYALWRDMSRYSKLWQYLKFVRKTALLWMKRAKLLQGQGFGIGGSGGGSGGGGSSDNGSKDAFENMQYGELMELIASQEFGLQRSRMALSLMLLEQQQMQVMAKSLS